MNRLVTKLRRRLVVPGTDAGMSIVEVIAAMVIFMIISVGIAQATVVAIRLAGDQKYRATALGLASTEIDLVRADPDIFALADRTVDRAIDGTNYTVYREVSWVDGNGADVSCGTASGGVLQLKRVNVRVTWDGQANPIVPVSQDTVLAPAGALADPSLGTLMVQVTRADGTGEPGVSVSLSPTPATPPTVTDAEGCSYIPRLDPGDYTVTISKAGGYIDTAQVTNPSRSVEVEEGQSVSVDFGYDRAATYLVDHIGTDSNTRFATNAEVSYISTYGIHTLDRAAGGQPLYPWPSGYSARAGQYQLPGEFSAGCLSVEPVEWRASGDRGDGEAPETVAAEPGGSVTLPVGWGRLTVQEAGSSSGRYVTAVRVAPSTVPGNADPGCGIAETYTFANNTLPSNSSSTVDIALPYGTWRIYRASSSGGTNRDIRVVTNHTGGAIANPSGNGQIAVLDPRPVL